MHHARDYAGRVRLVGRWTTCSNALNEGVQLIAGILLLRYDEMQI